MLLRALILASLLPGCADGALGDSAEPVRSDSDTGVHNECEKPPPVSAPVDGGLSAPDTTPAADTEPVVDAAPPPPMKLPLPDMSKVVEAVGAAHPEWVARSCQSAGGTWELMDAMVDELRKTDTRWGYNWKRGVIGDPSNDAIDYHWGAGPSEGSKDVYIIDVVVGHCGSSPAAGWIDVTEATAKGGTIGIWTGRGRF